jgi:hypothetical protein
VTRSGFELKPPFEGRIILGLILLWLLSRLRASPKRRAGLRVGLHLPIPQVKNALVRGQRTFRATQRNESRLTNLFLDSLSVSPGLQFSTRKPPKGEAWRALSCLKKDVVRPTHSSRKSTVVAKL